MKKRYEGFLASNGLYVLDTFSGEVKFISHEGIVATKSELTNTISSSLIQTTVNSDKKEFTSFEQEVVSAYPYLIARPFSDLLSENDPRMKCKLMVDTFTAILKYMSLQLASEYIRAPELKDVQIHQTLTKDLSRPLISAWNLLIARSLPVFKDKGIRLFSPEIKNAYEKLESKCKDHFLVTQSYSDENGNYEEYIRQRMYEVDDNDGREREEDLVYDDSGEMTPRGRIVKKENNCHKYEMLDVDGYNNGDVAPRGWKVSIEVDLETCSECGFKGKLFAYGWRHADDNLCHDCVNLPGMDAYEC